MKRRIVRMDQSPMNAKRWLVELECGHEQWQAKPRGEMAVCEICTANETAAKAKKK